MKCWQSRNIPCDRSWSFCMVWRPHWNDNDDYFQGSDLHINVYVAECNVRCECPESACVGVKAELCGVQADITDDCAAARWQRSPWDQSRCGSVVSWLFNGCLSQSRGRDCLRSRSNDVMGSKVSAVCEHPSSDNLWIWNSLLTGMTVMITAMQEVGGVCRCWDSEWHCVSVVMSKETLSRTLHFCFSSITGKRNRIIPQRPACFHFWSQALWITAKQKKKY